MMRGRSFDERRKRRRLEDVPFKIRETKAGPPQKKPRLSLPRSPSMLSSGYFVRAVGDVLVDYKEPVFDWEMTDDAWYFWDFVPFGADISMRDKNPEGTFEEDKKRADEALDRMQTKINLEYEVYKTCRFLSDNVLVSERQVQPRWSGTPLRSAKEQPEELISVMQLCEQLYSSPLTKSFLSDPENSKPYSPKLGKWLIEKQENGCLMFEPLVASRKKTFNLNPESHSDIRLGSQLYFGHNSCVPSTDMLSSWLGYMQEPILDSTFSDRHGIVVKSSDLSLVPNEVQHLLPVMQPANQNFLHLSRNSIMAPNQRQYLQDLNHDSLYLLRNSMIAPNQQHQQVGMQHGMPNFRAVNCKQQYPQHLNQDSAYLSRNSIITPNQQQQNMDNLMSTFGAGNCDQQQRLGCIRQHIPWTSDPASDIETWSTHSFDHLMPQHNIDQNSVCYDHFHSQNYFPTW
ncbi:uncharacterized protein LOC122015145 [Zingiber officinale]|uniref:Uncharacterized protein n=1 Tax=Zingiber officinale TaxID=94328 RepID=A0A8J5F790_ZINOF|nr:uncharacterized protein LOC122015145 [Zingiber officinale]KAG6481660.1 hypothetical protein ZIOFF_058278 [Zingiber officinale]